MEKERKATVFENPHSERLQLFTCKVDWIWMVWLWWGLGGKDDEFFGVRDLVFLCFGPLKFIYFVFSSNERCRDDCFSLVAL